MTITLSSSKSEILDFVTRTWRRGANHIVYMRWRQYCIDQNSQYDGGEGQWLKADIQALKEAGEIPITVNVTSGFVDTLRGVESESKYRNIARVDDDSEEARNAGRALTQFLLWWQEENNLQFVDSLRFKDTLVGGISWGNAYYEDGFIKGEWIDPLSMIFDANDITPQFTDSDFAGRMHWMRPEDLKLMFKSKVKDLVLDDYQADTEYLAGALLNRTSVMVEQTRDMLMQGKRLVCELQYKIPAMAYRGTAKNGRGFTTFDLEKAEEVALSPKDIEQYPSKRIMRTLFFNEIILSHSFLTPSYPDQQDFSYIPFVWKRRNADGMPCSFIEPIRSLQMELNARFTKAINSINSQRIFIKQGTGKGAISGFKDVESLKKHIFKKKSVTILSNDADIKELDGIVLGEEQVKFCELTIEMMKRVCGIYDDMRGGNSSQTSGIAEQIRINNSIRTNSFIFDQFSFMKKRMCLSVLKIFQETAGENYYIPAMEEFPSFLANLVIEKINGDVEVLNDINFLPFNLVIEEVPNFNSSLAMKKNEWLQVFSNPNAELLVLNPEFLKNYTDDPEKMVRGFMQAMQMRAQIQSGVTMQGQQGQTPPGNDAEAQQLMLAQQ